MLLSHPRDFTPVCTTELGQVALLERHFERRGVKLIGLSIDTVVSHEQWVLDIRETQGTTVHFPIVADVDRSIATLYGMLHPDHDSNHDAHGVATPALWRVGGDMIIQPSISDEEARTRFPRGWHALKPYLRVTPDPRV